MVKRKLSSVILAFIIATSIIPASYANAEPITTYTEANLYAVNIPIPTINLNLPQAIKEMLDRLTGVINKYITDYKELPVKTDIPKDKVWAITFGKEVDKLTMTGNTIKVLDVNGKEVNVTIRPTSNLKVWEVLPPTGGYTEGQTYALIVRKGIEGKENKSLKLKQEIAMKFVIKADNGTVQRDSIDTIIKTLAGNRYIEPKDRTYKEWNDYHSSIMKDRYDVYNVSYYHDYVNSIKTFQSKYANNPLYSDITDLDYYKKLPNLTINFDNVNNSNNYARGTGVTQIFFSKTLSNMPKSRGVTINPYLTSSGMYRVQMNLLKDETGFGTFIWRPDFEKAMLDEINSRRKAKGLNPLTLNNDLVAMAKHSAKLSQLGFTHNPTYTAGVLFGTGRIWARGTVPFAYDNTQYMEHFNPDSAVSKKFETNASKMFGYNKPLKAISESTAIFTTPKQIINAWEYKDTSMESFYIHSSELRVSYCPTGTTKEKFDSPVNLNENIYNPNMKTIGIGCTYEPPITKEDKNGTLGLFILTGN